MNRLTFGVSKEFTMALLLKSNAVFQDNKQKILINYLIPLSRISGIPLAKDMCVLPAYHPSTGNLKKVELVEETSNILEYCRMNGIETLLVGDGKYFEYLTGEKGLEKQIGKIFECVVEDYDMKILPVLNYTSLDMNPDKQPLQDRAFKTIADELNGCYSPDEGFEFESYEMVTEPSRAKELLKDYLKYDKLACDIETTGLPVGPTEILTIAFGHNTYNAFTIMVHDMYGYGYEDTMHDLLKGFFHEFSGRLLFHNGLYDVKHLVYCLYMDGFKDTVGMREGLDDLAFDDTFVLSFLDRNSTSRPSLGLKDLSFPLLGDYGENVKDATLLDAETISLYNSKDIAGTWYVYDKCKHMIDTRIYREIMEPSYRPLLKMMLNGMNLDLKRVEEVRIELSLVLQEAEAILAKDENVQLVERNLRFEAAEKYNNSHKVMRKTSGDFRGLSFNPNSSKQLQMLLFDVLNFQPVELTAKGAPKTDRASIQEFLTYADAHQKLALEALINISQTSIILNTFLHAFETMSITQDGVTTLHGNLRLGGTQSGRLSSNEPNMQNLPSNSKSGKAIKSCFPAPEGWLFFGADFSALEDRIGAILSKDVNKTKEFLEGYDG